MPSKEEAAARVFSFSYDENVYRSDVEKIVAAARAFPTSKVFCYVPSWSDEGQTFVLADSPSEARELYIVWLGFTEPSDNEKIKESDFQLTEG